MIDGYELDFLPVIEFKGPQSFPIVFYLIYLGLVIFLYLLSLVTKCLNVQYVNQSAEQLDLFATSFP